VASAYDEHADVVDLFCRPILHDAHQVFANTLDRLCSNPLELGAESLNAEHLPLLVPRFGHSIGVEEHDILELELRLHIDRSVLDIANATNPWALRGQALNPTARCAADHDVFVCARKDQLAIAAQT